MRLCGVLALLLLSTLLSTVAAAADVDGDGIPDNIDCNDNDAAIYPGAPETCDDGIDQDCIDNSCVIDEVTGDEDCAGGDRLSDVDGDGFANDRCGGLDCDDRDATLRPVDGDGDGYTSCDGDCDDADAAVDPIDDDADGFTECAGDCDDSDVALNPLVEEACGDALDNDCDGGADNVDLDGDGAVSPDCGGDDCDDEDATFSPLALETGPVCNDTLDNDCDGNPDEGDSDCFEAPEAHAGRNVQDRYLGGTALVALDGSGTTDFNGGDVLTYTWVVVADADYPGAEWTLETDPASPFAFLRFSVAPGEASEWSFRATLTVSDGVAETEDDEAAVTVRFWRPDYVPPKACAAVGRLGAPHAALLLALVVPVALRRRHRRA